MSDATREVCPNCGQPKATDEEWETVPGGARPDLCWGEGANCVGPAGRAVREAYEAGAESMRERAAAVCRLTIGGEMSALNVRALPLRPTTEDEPPPPA